MVIAKKPRHSKHTPVKKKSQSVAQSKKINKQQALSLTFSFFSHSKLFLGTKNIWKSFLKWPALSSSLYKTLHMSTEHLSDIQCD